MVKDIILEIQQKNQSGLKKLYDSYGPAIYGIILRITRNEGVAQELLQNTFLKVWNNINSYNSDKGSFFTWISTIARNTAIDKIRLKEYSRNQKTESFDSHVHNNKVVNISSDKIDIQNLLSNIDEKYRLILDKIYLEGYSHRELSKELDLPLGTIKSRLRIGISKLRDQLKNEKGLFMGLLLVISILIIIKFMI